MLKAEIYHPEMLQITLFLAYYICLKSDFQDKMLNLKRLHRMAVKYIHTMLCFGLHIVFPQ